MQTFTVHYINLAQRKDRNATFQSLNSGELRFERIEAVVGKELSESDMIRDKLIQEPLPHYSPGGIGNALSHKKLWDMAANRGTAITVAEDDAIFNRYFARKACGVLSRLPDNWDIILWGWNFDSFLHIEPLAGAPDGVMNFYPQTRGRVLDVRKEEYDVMPLRLFGACGTVCYSVSAAGAKQLAELCFPLKNEFITIPGMFRTIPNSTIDTVMNQHYRALQAYVCFPPLVYTENDKSSSDISQ